MVNNKIVLSNGTTLLDLTADTVDAAHLLAGYTAHDRSGAAVTGTLAAERIVLSDTRPADLGENDVWLEEIG